LELYAIMASAPAPKVKASVMDPAYRWMSITVEVAETSAQLELYAIMANAPALKVKSPVMDPAYRWMSIIAGVAETFA
jgi:hypothetical protein